MRKYINISFLYAILACVCGVFYREFTKWTGFKGQTQLSVLHTHLFVLGMIMFLIISIFVHIMPTLLQMKQLKTFNIVYNAGIGLTTLMFLIRGITQVKELTLSKAVDASISGIAGIGHLLLFIGLLLFFNLLRKAALQ